MSSTLAIETRRLTKRYGDFVAVDQIALAVPEGVVFGFLGPNGAGKSTTLRMLCGQLEPTSGEATVAGLSPSRDREALKRAIGYMPQAFGLYPYLTVIENLLFYAELYLDDYALVRPRTAEVIHLIGMLDRRHQLASELSGGWKQRLALGCAILHEPRVLFLDEPTVGVDPVSRRLFWDLIHKLNEQGVTIFVTTHYMEELERCHGVAFLSGGKLRAQGSPRALKAAVGASRQLVTAISSEPERALAALRGQEGLLDAYLWGEEIRLSWALHADPLGQTRAALAGAGLPARMVEGRAPTMEDVFVASQAST